jgi:hypothetical protein
MFSILGGITKAGWDAVFSKVESVESGFLSRVNIVATEGHYATVGGMEDPDFASLRRRFFQLILDLIERPRRISPTPSAY